MHTHGDSIAEALAGNGEGPLTPLTIDRLRKVQSETLDGRWEAMLDDFRRRAPFKNLPALEQRGAFIRLGRFGRPGHGPGRKFGPPRQLHMPIPKCYPDWQEIASLGTGSFDYGSADTPQVVPINDPDSPSDGYAGYTSVAVTFPHTGQIGIGAAVGNLEGGSPWAASQTLYAGQGNRASASLTKGFPIPDFAQLAPNALTASCSVLLPACNFALIVGSQYGPSDAGSMVYLCGQATLDLVACNALSGELGGQFPSKSGSSALELFTELGFSTGGTDIPTSSNIPYVYGNTATSSLDSFDPAGITPNMSYDLSATIDAPPATANFLVVTVSVEVSAWTLPADVSFAVIDATGQNTGLPLLTIPLFPPWYLNDVTTSATNTQPIQITNLRVYGGKCG
jgi:hypothetical protein